MKKYDLGEISVLSLIDAFDLVYKICILKAYLLLKTTTKSSSVL